jgi:phosphinothricin acetyltransferase
VIVRDAIPDDAPALAAIYAHHVLNGTATFDTDPPSTDSWRAKIIEIQCRNWPIVVVERRGEVVGYAYATQFRDRAAYAATCENSIYVAPDALGSGIGTALLRDLIAHAARAGFEQMIAVIGGDEPASVALHSKLGFSHAGRMRNVGRKFGRLLDTVYMQLALSSEQRPAR